MLRRLSLAIALSLGASVVIAPDAQAARGTAPDGTWVQCAEETPPAYVMVGGAPIWIHSSANMGGSQTRTTIDCTSDGVATSIPPRWSPADGTFVQGRTGAGVLAPVYEVVGGAPLYVSSWPSVGYTPASHPATEVFDNQSLPALTGAEQSLSTSTPSYTLYGYFSSLVRDAYFKSLSGTIYRTDGAGHPSIVSRVPAGRVAPVVDQRIIDACTRMNCSPWGDITIDVVGKGRVHVSGYALDAMTTRQVTVRLQGAGRTIDVPADQPDASINAGYGVSGSHGFDRVLSVPSGHYDLCATFVGFAPGGTTTPVGCQVVDVPGSKPGRVHRPKVASRGHRRVLVKWKQPATHGSPVTIYLVKTSTGKKRRVAGAKHRVLLKHLPGRRALAVRVKAINGVGPGRFSKPSKRVRVR